MFSEQAFLNAGPLIVRGLQGAAAAGFIFNVLMIARAPLQLFQAVSTSILPHLTSLHTSDEPDSEREFHRSVRMVLLGVAAFTAFTALVVLIAGPQLMQIAFSNKFSYDRAGLLLVDARDGPLPLLGHGQPGLRRPGPGAPRRRPLDRLRRLLHRLELRAAGRATSSAGSRSASRSTAGVLFALLYLVYRRPHERAEDVPAAGLPRGARGAPGGDRRERLGRSTRVRRWVDTTPS